MKDYELTAFIGMQVTMITPDGYKFHGPLHILRSSDHVICLSEYERIDPNLHFVVRGVNGPAIFSNGYRIIFDRAPEVEISIERTH